MKLQELFEGAMARNAAADERWKKQHAKSVSNLGATFDTLPPKGQASVTLAVSAARKIAKVSKCTPLSVIRWWHEGSSDAKDAWPIDKWMYTDEKGVHKSSPKKDEELMKLTGATAKELKALMMLNFRDELIVAKTLAKQK